jgi:hypothetical protein
MTEYKVEWVKRYYRTGTLIVEANSAEEADYLVWNMDQDEWENGDEELHHDESEIDAVLEEKEDA